MKGINHFNPLKSNINYEHAEFLSNLIPQVDGDVCFVGDEVGYFFAPVRRIKHPSICFNKKHFYDFHNLLKVDCNLAERIFLEYDKLFNLNLIEHFEERVFSEKNVFFKSYMLICLCNLSENIDYSFSNYNPSNLTLIGEAIKKISNFFIGNNKIYYQEVPKGNFIISYETEIDREGVLITRKKRNLDFMKKINNLNYYYVEGK